MTELPKGWEKSTLGELVDAIREQSKIENTKTYELWSIPSFSDGAPEIIQGSEIGSSKLKVIRDDILISKINPRINRVWLVEDSILEQLASPEWLVARIKDSNAVDKKFLQFYLSSPEFRDWISRAASSVTGSHSRAKANDILQRDIPLPPIDEQHKIVELLEDHLSRLDTALVDVKQAKIKAAQFRRSLLQAAFTGNLGFHRAISLTEIPSDWSWVTLDEAMSECKNGLTYRNKPELAGFPVSRIETISKGEIDFQKVGYGGVSLDGNQKHVLIPGDILFSHINSILHVGKVAIYKSGMPPLLHGMNLLRITPSDDFVPEFLFHLFQSSDVRKQIWSKAKHAVNQASINIGELKTVIVPKPPIEEQQKIVEILEGHLSRLAGLVALAEVMEKQSNGLRRSLLQAAFTGQLTKEVASV
jgi:type I restriction enzyme S subunit